MKYFLLVILHLLITENFNLNQDESSNLFAAYRILNDVSREHNIPFEIPRLCVVGIQSAGKTTLLELYAKIPLGFTSTSTGTRCPVEYTFINDPTITKPVIEFEGHTYNEQEVLVKLEEEMLKLSRTVEGFSSKILRVSITSSDVSNMVLVDLPGLIPSPKAEDLDRAERVTKIVQKFARDKSYYLVAVLKCSEGRDTIADLDVLNKAMVSHTEGVPPPRPDWKKETVMVVNYINLYMSQHAVFPNVQETQKWIESQQDDGQRFFVILKPDEKFIREKASVSDIGNFLKNQPLAEESMFNNWKSELESRSSISWPSDVDKYLSVKNARKEIDKLFMQAFKNQVPHLVEQLNTKLIETQAQLADVTKRLDNLNPAKYQQNLRSYTHDYTNHLSALITSTLLRTRTGEDIFSYNDAKMYTFKPSKYGKTWEEELVLHTSKDMRNWKFLIKPEDLKSVKHLGQQPLGEQLNRRLVGAASFKRLLQLTSYFLYNIGMQEMDDDSIYNHDGYNPNHIDTFPTERVVSQMVRSQLMKLGEGYKFLRSHLLGIASSYSESVHEFLLNTEYQHFNNDQIVLGLCFQMSKEYKMMLEEQLHIIGERMQQNIKMYSEYLRTDLPIRTMMMSVVNPMQDRILKEEEFKFQEVNKEDQSEQVHGESDTYWWNKNKNGDGPGEDKKDVEHDEPLGQTNYSRLSLGTVEPIGIYLTNIPREKNIIHKRLKQLREVLHTYRDFTLQNQNIFNLGDIVTGGFSTFRPVDRASLDIGYLISCAFELYVHYVFWIVFDMEMAVQHYIIEYLPKDGKKNLTDRIGKLVANTTDDDIAKVLGMDKKALDELKEIKTVENQHLEEARVMLGLVRQLVS